MKSREIGNVVTFNGTYAFIRPDLAERDVFAHVSQFPTDKIRRGDRVSYDLVPDPYKGNGKMHAVAVRFIDGDDDQKISGEGAVGASALADGLMRDQQSDR
jgi:cold shock CspA family protein